VDNKTIDSCSNNIVLTIAYDGSDYLGWQKTSFGASVEATLTSTIEQILQHKVKLQAASRTDKGVHATGQVVNFFSQKQALDLKKLQHSLNQLLPDDIAVLDLTQAEDQEFHPTLSAKGKEYHYHLALGPYLLPQLRKTHWHLAYPIDTDLLREACSYFIGKRDFKTFCNQRKDLRYEDTIRTLFDIKIEESAHNTLRIVLIGDHFLYKMARNIVGTLVYVAAQKISLDELPSIIEGKKRDEAGITAPAHGLSLHKIYYTSSF
jgi:tRNA pseudouridine38-40 synthase